MNNIAFPIILVLLGVIFLYTGEYSIAPGIKLDIGIFKWPGGLLLIFIGIYSYLKRNKNKIIEHSICPKCKETYFYKDLKDGKCPTCKVDNIDIDEYYNNK